MNFRFHKWFFILLPVSGFCLNSSFAQDVTPIDSSAKSGFLSKVAQVRKIAGAEAARASEKYQLSLTARKQRLVIEEIRKTNQQAEIFLKRKLDTLHIQQNLGEIDSVFLVVKEGIVTGRGSSPTERNLTISSAILLELISQASGRKNEVDAYMNHLVNYRDHIDSLTSNPVIYTFSSDSTSIVKYIQRLSIMTKGTAPVDSAINQVLSSAQTLQTRIDLTIFMLKSTLGEIENQRRSVSSFTFHREFPGLWEQPTASRPLNEIIRFSIHKEWIALKLYIRNSQALLLLMLILIGMSTVFISALRKKLLQDDGNSGYLIIKHPLYSAILIVSSFYQFVFVNPPFIFTFLIWIILTGCLSIIFHRFITRYWMTFWLTAAIFFLLAGTDNLILQASRIERWYMFALSVVGTIYGCYILQKGRLDELKEKYIIYSIRFMVLAQFASGLLNLTGRYNISKALFISGFQGVIVAILFLWVVRLINEGLEIATNAYQHPEKQLFYINFDKIGGKIPVVLYGLLFLGWLVIVGHNFYALRQLSDPVIGFFTQERQLGNYNFSINGLFLFLFIIACSAFISKILSFFVDNQPLTNTGTRATISSWLLLIRIAIISIGLFLAFAAVGIPIDRLTFVLGALGVGIGLGLQGLVNNLVSGLIIAFERPVSVGDIVQMQDQTGVMRSIGFRSSTVRLADGAHLIIPNGDLLSQHLMNWTKGNGAKRLKLPVRVAYDSDLIKTKAILLGILLADSRLLKSPKPLVAITQLGYNSIDFELLFWVHHTDDAGLLITDLIMAVSSEFKNAGIEIPFPQQDIHIKTTGLPLKDE